MPLELVLLRCAVVALMMQTAGAKAIYDDPADLLAHYDDSPLGKSIELTHLDTLVKF